MSGGGLFFRDYVAACKTAIAHSPLNLRLDKSRSPPLKEGLRWDYHPSNCKKYSPVFGDYTFCKHHVVLARRQSRLSNPESAPIAPDCVTPFRGTPVKNLAHNVSLHSPMENAPSNIGTNT
ncbi:hypothetical protein NVSP9465_02108 [Novosphingobium sp. CECT 9465]|nr:hypothetical protein NVSP9465_02108 [Novosphingobium sp. CECT 9465]